MKKLKAFFILSMVSFQAYTLNFGNIELTSKTAEPLSQLILLEYRIFSALKNGINYPNYPSETEEDAKKEIARELKIIVNGEAEITAKRRKYFYELIMKIEAADLIKFIKKNSHKIKNMEAPISWQQISLDFLSSGKFPADSPPMRFFYIEDKEQEINPITNIHPIVMSVIVVYSKKSIQMPTGILTSPSSMLENFAQGLAQPQGLFSLKLHSYAADKIGAEIIVAYSLPGKGFEAGFETIDDADREKILGWDRKNFLDTQPFKENNYYQLGYIKNNDDFRSYWLD